MEYTQTKSVAQLSSDDTYT